MENASLCQTMWRGGKQVYYWMLACKISSLDWRFGESWLQLLSESRRYIPPTTNYNYQLLNPYSFTHLVLSVGGEEPQKVSEWSRLHAFLWGGESYWESFHRELRSWDHLSSSQHQAYLWEDTKRQEDTRGNLMPGVQSVGVRGKAKTSLMLHWYILAQR